MHSSFAFTPRRRHFPLRQGLCQIWTSSSASTFARGPAGNQHTPDSRFLVATSMAAPPPKRGRLSLYEDKISDESRAEIKARDDAAVAAKEAQKKKDAALLFKPTSLGRKPINNPQKARPKPNPANIPKWASSSPSVGNTAAAQPLSSSDGGHISSTPQQPQGNSQKRGFDDWLANEDEEYHYYEKDWRGLPSKKNKKQKQWPQKKKQPKNKQTHEDFGEIYDPSRPVNFVQYAKSDEALDLKEAWKTRLYNAERRERKLRGLPPKSPLRDERQTSSADRGRSVDAPPQANRMFAPPTEYESSAAYARQVPSRSPSPVRFMNNRDNAPTYAPPMEIPREETAEEAYARRVALSGMPVAPSPPVTRIEPPPPPPEPVQKPTPKPLSAEDEEKRAKVTEKLAQLKVQIAAQKAAREAADAAAKAEQQSREPEAMVPAIRPEQAPVEFQNFTQQDLDDVQAVLKRPDEDMEDDLAARPILGSGAPADTPSPVPTTIVGAPTYNPEYFAKTGTVAAAPKPSQEKKPKDPLQESYDRHAFKSNKPGQVGFAERQLRKYGWEEGKGLGAGEDGMSTAILFKNSKQGKNEGIGSAKTVKIIPGKKSVATVAAEKAAADQDRDADMSEVVKLEGMLDGLDVDYEISENDLLQEIGDEVASYGKVERVFIWRPQLGGKDEVFVKFTSQLSALRAVKGMGNMEFGQNRVRAKFWDTEKFEAGVYE
ncbi:hypothetical protein TI39_contig625g00015 [Zymoseptoria brevis]|uniref:G-patch domain-containing protein n=1 Tax=Zymoseptoria brevis TaxID=1047168 RepID=A0A0F4GG93_9PEZI|nr:hypothetical protein TI39_contig625g00015 [Zymoseptoria brevis]